MYLVLFFLKGNVSCALIFGYVFKIINFILSSFDGYSQYSLIVIRKATTARFYLQI